MLLLCDCLMSKKNLECFQYKNCTNKIKSFWAGRHTYSVCFDGNLTETKTICF